MERSLDIYRKTIGKNQQQHVQPRHCTSHTADKSSAASTASTRHMPKSRKRTPLAIIAGLPSSACVKKTKTSSGLFTISSDETKRWETKNKETRKGEGNSNKLVK
uniref:Uncharacterized protein n=1 Tax=Glossina palpalis gambiensis TaxID=67801 RepID=A0A1B0BWS2_9MUSC